MLLVCNYACDEKVQKGNGEIHHNFTKNTCDPFYTLHHIV